MSTVTPIIPSGSTNGKPIKVVASATAGTTFHISHATAFDEIWMWISNTDSVDRTATIELGGVTSPDNLVKIPVPAGDTVLAIAGARLTGTVTIGVFGSVANVLTMHGNINRYS